MTYSTIRWILLAAMVAFVPLLYYMFVVGGFLPYAVIAIATLRSPGPWGLLLFNGIQLLVYGGLLLLIASWLARRISKIATPRRNVVVIVVVTGLAALGLLPIYGAGHSSMTWVNAYQLYGLARMQPESGH